MLIQEIKIIKSNSRTVISYFVGGEKIGEWQSPYFSYLGDRIKFGAGYSEKEIKLQYYKIYLNGVIRWENIYNTKIYFREYQGRTLREIVKQGRSRVPMKTLIQRIRGGWTIENALLTPMR